MRTPASTDPRIAGILAAGGIPLLVTCLLGAAWVHSGRIRLFGDEPHYVIIAKSLLRDGDFEIRNNHALEERFPEYVGEVAPHAHAAGHRWYPLHGPGLALLIAPGLAAAGVLGARLTTCAVAAVLPIALFLWLNGLVGRRDAARMTLAATLSVPYIFGAVHLYPDGVAAALVTPLFLFASSPTEKARPPAAWAAFWLVSGLLPLLMVKFLAPSLLLAVFALAWGWPRSRGPAERRAMMRAAPWFLFGPLVLAGYHVTVFGNVTGPRGMGELTAVPTQVFMTLLGLHLDQAQGIFVQQPLLVAGVPAFGIMAVRRPAFAAAWCLLYASIIAPNVLQVIPFGGASPSGRFAWAVAWMWMVPLGLTLTWYRGRLQRVLLLPLGAVFAYQAALAVRWLPTPMAITNEFTPDLALRNSLFPAGVREWLPSFYALDFLSFPPNLVALAILVILLASGPLLGMRLVRRRG